MKYIVIQYSGPIRHTAYTPDEVLQAVEVIRNFLENNWANSKQAHHYSVTIEDIQDNLSHGVFTY